MWPGRWANDGLSTIASYADFAMNGFTSRNIATTKRGSPQKCVVEKACPGHSRLCMSKVVRMSRSGKRKVGGAPASAGTTSSTTVCAADGISGRQYECARSTA